MISELLTILSCNDNHCLDCYELLKVHFLDTDHFLSASESGYVSTSRSPKICYKCYESSLNENFLLPLLSYATASVSLVLEFIHHHLLICPRPEYARNIYHVKISRIRPVNQFIPF